MHEKKMERADMIMASHGPLWQIHLLCVIWSWDRDRIMSPFILSSETYRLCPLSLAHTHKAQQCMNTNTSEWSHASAAKIPFNKSFNCLINAGRAMQMKPIVDRGWVRLNVRALADACR